LFSVLFLPVKLHSLISAVASKNFFPSLDFAIVHRDGFLGALVAQFISRSSLRRRVGRIHFLLPLLRHDLLHLVFALVLAVVVKSSAPAQIRWFPIFCFGLNRRRQFAHLFDCFGRVLQACSSCLRVSVCPWDCVSSSSLWPERQTVDLATVGFALCLVSSVV
jgi:hypothetical protein